MEMRSDRMSVPASMPWFCCLLWASSAMLGKFNGLEWVADKPKELEFREKQNLVTTVVQVYF